MSPPRKKSKPKGQRAPAKPAGRPAKGRSQATRGEERAQTAAQAEELQSALAELEASRNRYADLFDQSPIAYFTNDGRGQIWEANLTAARLLGRPRERLKGMLLNIFVLQRIDLQKMLQHLRLCRTSTGEIRTQMNFKGADGASVLPIELVSRPIASETDRFHTAVIDMRAQKKHDAALHEARDTAEKATRAKDDFIATLSHELRTPLNPILLIASDAAANATLPTAVRDDFGAIARNVSLEARLIDDLLDLTRITHGKLTLERKQVDANNVLREALHDVSTELRAKQIATVVELEPVALGVLADTVRLQQVFWNVLRNAAKFTPHAGRVQVRSSHDRAGNKIVFTITDSGLGIEPKELERIFDPFVQIDPAQRDSGRASGLGLGLAISRKLVQLHEGRIYAQSAGPMQGSTFTIELPLTDKPLSELEPVVAPQPAPIAKLGRGRRVLLVEDHEPTRTALARLLKMRDFAVTAAGTVAGALAHAEAEKFDFLISDIGLPDGEGHTIMQKMQGDPGLRGIALTGYGMEGDFQRSRESGFAAHLTKPVQIEQLERTLQQLSDSPKSSQTINLRRPTPSGPRGS